MSSWGLVVYSNRARWWYEVWLPSSGGWCLVSSSFLQNAMSLLPSFVFAVHLFGAWLFVWLSFYISRYFKQNTNTNMFFWMLFIRFFNCGKLFNCLTGFLKLLNCWGEKGGKVKAEEQLVLTMAQDRNRNSDSLSPNFPYIGKKRNPISESLKQKHSSHIYTKCSFLLRVRKMFSTFKAISLGVEDEK